MKKLRSCFAVLICVMVLVSAAVPSYARYGEAAPYDKLELHVKDIYNPGGPTVYLNDAVVFKSDIGTVTFYSDAECTQKVSLPVTLTKDTQFWAINTSGAWKSPVVSFWVYVSGLQMDLSAKSGDNGMVTLTARLNHGDRVRIPSGEISFYLDGEYIGSAMPAILGETSFSFPSPAAGTYTVTCQFFGDANYSPVSASAQIVVTSSGVELKNADVEKSLAAFEKFFSNKFAAVGVSANGKTTHYLLDADLSGLDTEELYFYFYNPTTGTYKEAMAFVDYDERVNFVSAESGVLIISEGKLEKR